MDLQRRILVKSRIWNITAVLALFLGLMMNHLPAALATEVGGIIDSDTVWTLDKSPYFAGGNILVKEGVTLEIEPGVTVRFRTAPIQPLGYYLRVDGTLLAQGSEEHPILFTAEDENYPWGCIVFTDSSTDWNEEKSAGSVLRHCVIEYAGKGQEASVLTVSASPLIADSIIRYGVAHGIRTLGGYQNIVSNLVHNNNAAIHLSCDGGLIENNYLIDNQQGIYLDSSLYTIEIKNNTIINASPEPYGACMSIHLYFHSDEEAEANAAQANAVIQAAAQAKAAADEAVAQATASGDVEAYVAAMRAADEADARFNAAADAAEIANATAIAFAESMTAKIQIQNNRIINRSGNAISVTEYDPRANYEFSVTNNTIENTEGNLSVFLYSWKHENPELLDMTGNWWGTTDDIEIDQKIYDANNDFYLPKVNYQPIATKEIPNAGSDLSYTPPDGEEPEQPGVITEDTLWTVEESPYIITTNILIKENVTLEIEPGVTVQFTTPGEQPAGYYIRVDGILKAAGTKEKPILFTAQDTASPWGCIAFTDTSTGWDETASAGSVLEYCIIEYAGVTQKGEDEAFGGAAIKNFSASPLIANNTVRYSAGMGIWASGGKQRILSNLIHDNTVGIALSSEGALIENNYIADNAQGIYLDENTGKIEINRNTVISNSSETRGACLSINLYHHEKASEIVVSRNHITSSGNAIAISAKDPETNDEFRFTYNIIENTGGNFSVYLYDWQSEDPDPVPMTANWWGTADTGIIDSMIYDAADDFYLPRVDYQPIATKEITDAGSTISYQPLDDYNVPKVISRDTRWTAEKSPYIITGNLLVKENVTLEIEPGVTVRFETPSVPSAGYYIRVDGALKAVGSEEKPILFTAKDPASPWGCIAFMDTSLDWDETASAGSVLKHCIIEYAGNSQEGSAEEFGGAAIINFSASPLIENNTIRYSAGEGIRTSGGKQRILSNLIHDNTLGIALSSQGAVVENNAITNNGQGIWLGDNTNRIEITGNTIISSSPEIYGACLSVNLYRHETPSKIVISRNHILSNNGNAIAVATHGPDANDDLSFTFNTIENAGGNLSVYLHDWQSENPDPVSMTANWWGTADTGEIDQMIHDAADDSLIPRVEYQPMAIKEISDVGSDLSYPSPDDGDAPGVISRNTRWTVSESPYLITGNILVKENVILEIEPGVTVRFKTPPVPSVGYYIRVNGTLRAVGEEENPILFTAETPANLWGCIAFMDTSSDWHETTSAGSVLKNCIIEYAGNSQTSGLEEFGGAGIKCFSASPLIENNTVRYNAGIGIWVSGGTQRILSNLIHDNPLGIVISAEDALLENNYMTNNNQGIYLAQIARKIEIRNNTIISNSPETSGACFSINLYRHEEPSEIVISGNHIANRIGNAIAVASHDPNANDELRLTSNTIENTGGNLAVYLHDWQGDTTESLNMTANWWGTMDISEIDRMIYDANNDFNLPQVKYQPIAVKAISGAGSDIVYSPSSDEPDDHQPGVISEDTIWAPHPDGSPHIITGNILVKKNVTLKIEPGVTVAFRPAPVESLGYYIRVDGTLNAQGTEVYPIIFTSEDPAGAWGCIAFTDSSAAWDETTLTGCVLSHCIIEYAGNSQEGGQQEFGGAAIKSFSASPLIENSLIRYAAGEGIWASGGYPRILGNRIHDTSRAMMLSPENALIENNYLISNGQGVYLNSGAGRIEIINNSILNIGEESGVIRSSAVVYGGCMSISLYRHDGDPEIDIHGNHIISSAGNAVAITSHDPDANAELRLTSNNIENSGGNLSVYLHDWQQEKPGPLNMTDNWWGTVDVSEIDQWIYDSENDFYLPETAYQPIAFEQIPGAWSVLTYPPLAYAGPDQEVDGDVVVILDGSYSFDPDDVMSYQWTQTGGRSVTLSDTDAVKATFVSPSVSEDDAILIFQLTVKDELGFWNSDEVSITINESLGVQMERDKGQCFISGAVSNLPDIGYRFILVILLLLICAAFNCQVNREEQSAMIPKRMDEYLRDHLPEPAIQNRMKQDGGLCFLEFGYTDEHLLSRLEITCDKQTIAIENGLDGAVSKPADMSGNRIDEFGAAMGKKL